jgi:hypothetical protein
MSFSNVLSASGLGRTLSISHETDELGNHLIASVRGVPGHDTAEFFPASETSFNVNPITTSDDIRLTFVRNRKGKTTRVSAYWNGTKLRGTRIPNQPGKVTAQVRIRLPTIVGRHKPLSGRTPARGAENQGKKADLQW